MGITSNLRTLLHQLSKELRLFQHYTKKVEEKLTSSTFPHGMKLKIYLKQHRPLIRIWMYLLIFLTLQHNQKFKGNTTDPQTEITFTFADPNFDFEDGDVLSYYRNIIEPDYQYERTKGIQFENMTIAIDGNNYIVKSTSADGETVHINTFKKIDDVTISWISEGKEIVLTENLEQ